MMTADRIDARAVCGCSHIGARHGSSRTVCTVVGCRCTSWHAPAVTGPTVDQPAVVAYLAALPHRFVAPSVHVVLAAGETAWQPGGPPLAGPGVVRYTAFRDGGVGASQIDDAVTAAALLERAGGTR